MKESALTKKQTLLIEDIMEEISLYKEEMNRQIKNAKFNVYLGIGLAVIIGVLVLLKPQFLQGIMDKISTYTSSMEQMGSLLIGEGLPVFFGLKSFNTSKEQKKRLKGVRVFEKDLKRMKEGLISNSEEHILNLEKEFSRYINT